MKRYLTLAVLCAASATCLAAPHHRAVQTSSNSSPDCASWPVNMGSTMLQNMGLLPKSPDIDWDKIKATRLASEKVGKDLYVQVYDITFPTKSGATLRVITRNTASHEECSMSSVDIYVVSRTVTDKDVVAAVTKPKPVKK